MKTLYPTLVIVLSVILTSCGMSTNFNKRKYTNFKKSKSVYEVTPNEIRNQEDMISYHESAEDLSEEETASISGNVEDSQFIETKGEVCEKVNKKLTYKSNVIKHISESMYFKIDATKLEFLNEDSKVEMDQEPITRTQKNVRIGLLALSLLLSFLFIVVIKYGVAFLFGFSVIPLFVWGLVLFVLFIVFANLIIKRYKRGLKKK